MEVKRFSILFVLFIGVLLAFVVPYSRVGWGENDFLRYWSATKIFVSGGNPYSFDSLKQMQIAIKPELVTNSEIVQAWNPPWLMLLLSPLTLVNFNLATKVWILINISLITFSLYLVWEIVFQPNDRKGLIIIYGAGFLFSNTIDLLRLGQISSILLIGLVITIYFLQKKFFFWAGFGLLLLTIKPQITYLVLLVVLIWVIRNKHWRVIFGLAISGIISIIVVSIIFPEWLSAYLQTILSLPYSQIYTSTLGSLVEVNFGINLIKYIGILLIPLAFLLSKNVEKFGWLTVLNISLVISIPLAPYGFNFDHILLLPAVVQMISWIRYRELPANYAVALSTGIAIIYLFLISLTNVIGAVPYYWFVWPSILLAGLYLIGWAFTSEKYKQAY